MTAKTSISLTDQQYAFAKAQVEAGRFSSVSAVLQQALETMREAKESQALQDELLRELIRRRRAGPYVPLEEFDERIEAMLARRRRERGLPD